MIEVASNFQQIHVVGNTTKTTSTTRIGNSSIQTMQYFYQIC